MNSYDNVIAVQNMQDYIDEHLDDVITLKQLAQAANYSIWHSARVFKELVGKTPFEYIRTLRLSKAAMVLRDKKTRVIDVAFDFVFDSHEGFTKAFSKQFGISPKKYTQQTPPIPLFLPEHVYVNYLDMINSANKLLEVSQPTTIFIQVIERPKRKVLLKRAINATHYFEYCEEVDCDVWGILSSVKENLYEPVGLWLPLRFRKPNTSEYVQGIEVPLEYNNTIPDGFEIIELPECKMMIFQGPPFLEEEFRSAIRALRKGVKTYNPEVFGYTWADEDAPRFQLQPMGYRGYIEARPVKEIS